jgi:hypothetical protein
MGHAALREQVGLDVLREEEVRGVVAVQVADLVAADPEGELAAAPRSRLDSRPRRYLRGDALARCR